MKKTTFLLGFISLITTAAFSQAPVDGFYPGKGNGAVAVSGSFEQYDSFFLGNGSEANWAGDYNVNSISLYGTYGITEDLGIAVSIPYIMISTINFQGDDVTRKDLQDINIYAKYRAFDKDFGSWSLAISPALGFFTPLTNYTVDFYGVGQQATGFDLRGIAMATFDNGLFAELQGSGLVRFNPAPSGSTFNVKAGYFNSKWYADIYYSIQSIPGGEDLPDPEDFEALGVSFSKIGLTVAYNVTNAIGIYAGGAYVIDGLSVGQSTRYSGGAVWRF
ncbi:MAG TPA: hypothetical protein DHW15_09130 [Bacteroidetes bacterium]|jgi:hypothetical protein|nr:MAG: hypothetical protein ABR94_01285 [Sphingobacteriales bacterium BACL12 MAG-120802-bin5]KRP12627.1 MAG: hypothetical protein ABR95_03070 [Sphingobacteriales bacterium BACL12 MAG-120813-bin55]HCK22309.1 hypothetical protein [Bacteroidota bacterium]